MNPAVWRQLLRMAQWRVSITVPWRDKCVICVAPHTSNWDFLLGYAAWRSLGRQACFLMKESWFFFPLGILLRSLGGIPVPKKRGADLTASIVNRFNAADRLNLAVTPEGTRARTDIWRKGFLYIAYGAGVPLQLGVIDYRTKTIIVQEEYNPSGDLETDMNFIRKFYEAYADAALKPEKFGRLDS